MKMNLSQLTNISRRMLLALTVASLIQHVAIAQSDTPTPETSDPIADTSTTADTESAQAALDQRELKTEPNAAEGLRFSFERVPWRFVIQWLADEAGLAAHISDLPTGSFTYSDNRVYNPNEAISRINLFLIPERYALVRTDSLLTVINLDSEQSVRQLDALAPLVSVAELPSRGEHDVVKCIIPLGDTQPDVAIEEIGGLMLMNEPKVLKTTNQLVFTESVSKLRLVQTVLHRLLEPKPADEGPVERFDLGQLDANRVLAQIRPHVQLDPMAMIGPDIRLSIDDDGKQLLASGTKENLEAIASVLASLDRNVPAETSKPSDFRSHPIGTADLQTVMSVLQTLLADEDVRLAPDLKSNQIAVLGSEHVHEVVEKTILQLASDNAIEFRAIGLGSIDPRYAVMILSQMFNIVRPSAEITDSKAPADPSALKIEADPLSQRLFVRGTAEQIAEIEKAIEELAGQAIQPTGQSTVRVLPYQGERAQQILQSAAQFWPGSESVQIVPPTIGNEPSAIEREINPETMNRSPAQAAEKNPPLESTSPSDRSAKQGPRQMQVSLTSHMQIAGNSASPSIKAQVTPQGILVQAIDAQTLQQFEDHVRMIAGSSEDSPLGLTVFYLKHVQADVASQLLQDILDAEHFGKLTDGSFDYSRQIASFTAGGSAAADLDEYWSTGTATIIPDQRLNRIFVYGTGEDHSGIQKHLEVIDRQQSLADVKTFGVPKIIKLEHAKAAEVAAVVRDAYAGRIAETAKERQAAEQRRAQAEKEKKSSTPEPNTVSSNTQGPMMTLAVDEQTNSLVVTAPEQLSAEVEQLIRKIDDEATQLIQVRTLGTTAPQVHELLLNLLTEEGAPQKRQTSSKK